MKSIAVLVCGILFGAGVTVSGMINPARILNFLDVLGSFDPTLITVMAAALAVNFVGYRLALRLSAPVMDTSFQLPSRRNIDTKLVAGAALFGVGWGLSGFCPGPAVASLVFGYQQSFVFVIAMAAGIIATRWVLAAHPLPSDIIS